MEELEIGTEEMLEEVQYIVIKLGQESYGIKIDYVDNIDCTIYINFRYLEKGNEDKGDVSYTSSYSTISFTDYPEILK